MNDSFKMLLKPCYSKGGEMPQEKFQLGYSWRGEAPKNI